MKILLCGDGNGAHVFTCLATQQPDVSVSVPSVFQHYLRQHDVLNEEFHVLFLKLL